MRLFIVRHQRSGVVAAFVSAFRPSAIGISFANMIALKRQSMAPDHGIAHLARHQRLAYRRSSVDYHRHDGDAEDDAVHRFSHSR